MWERKRFISSFLVVALVALVAYGGIVFLASMIALDEVSQNDAQLQWQAFQRALHTFSAGMLMDARVYASDPRLATFLQSEADPSANPPMPAPWQAGQNAPDMVLLTNAEGHVRFSLGIEAGQAAEFLHTGVADRAMEGAEDSGLYNVNGAPLLLAAVPISSPANAPAGVLLFGRTLNDTLFDQLHLILGRGISLYQGEQRIASSKPQVTSREDILTECAANPEANLTLGKSPNGDHYIAGVLAGDEGPDLGCVQIDVVDFSNRTMRSAITFASIAAILLGLTASYIVARLISGQLADSAAALAARERENARLYAEVQQLNSRLETMISERTSQLKAAVSELQTAQTQLIQADRLAALGMLTSSIVQELSSPLSLILGYAQTLLQDEDDQSRRQCLEHIRDAAITTQDIALRIRTFSRRQRVRRELIDLNAIVHEALDLLGQSFEQDEIACELELEEKLPKIMADRVQAQQIVFNLMNNAREALQRSEQPRRIQVRTEARNGLVQLDVLDNGPGLTDQAQERLFTPFFSTKPPHMGTGIGLYVCQGIIEAYGGHISGANRTDGPGAIFSVELPTGITHLTAGRLWSSGEGGAS